MKIHIVQKGDTLWKIAKKYGVNFEALKKMNSQLSNPDMLMPGMKIKVPENTSAPQKKGGDTKVNFGTIKEAPISGGGATMKESIKPETHAIPSKPKEKPIVTPPPAVKEMPIQPMEIKKEKPVKEKPKMPYVAPQASVKPVIPEVDINNYYLMNMAKMEVQSPPPMPIIKEAPKVKEKPIKEKPIVKEKPKKHKKPMPMPQYDFCPPMMPYYDPCCPPVMMHPCMAYPTPYYSQPYMTGPVYHQSHFHQPHWGQGEHMDDSSSFHYGHHESTHMMGGYQGDHHFQQQGYYPGASMPSYGQYPMQGMHGYYQHPGYEHYGFESSPYGMESSSHMMDHHHHHHHHQQQYVPFDGYVPQGCGCNDTSQGTYYQPMTQMNQQGHGMGQPMAQYTQQEMTQPMYQQAAQQPYYQDAQFHQRYGGQEYAPVSPSFNPDGQHVIPHVEPAAFDRPRTQEESSEQEGQS